MPPSLVESCVPVDLGDFRETERHNYALTGTRHAESTPANEPPPWLACSFSRSLLSLYARINTGPQIRLKRGSSDEIVLQPIRSQGNLTLTCRSLPGPRPRFYFSPFSLHPEKNLFLQEIESIFTCSLRTPEATFSVPKNN